jgi:hypothetical protein
MVAPSPIRRQPWRDSSGIRYRKFKVAMLCLWELLDYFVVHNVVNSGTRTGNFNIPSGGAVATAHITSGDLADENSSPCSACNHTSTARKATRKSMNTMKIDDDHWALSELWGLEPKTSICFFDRTASKRRGGSFGQAAVGHDRREDGVTLSWFIRWYTGVTDPVEGCIN